MPDEITPREALDIAPETDLANDYWNLLLEVEGYCPCMEFHNEGHCVCGENP